ncbi:APC family permease [Candidatus Micrarchaeota archaeon]|nr:APC family permease [Candidatus Micrarchaeota archaeon]MBU1930256.1 APC family permease [Candidatus Micrarchaeota archaeon]
MDYVKAVNPEPQLKRSLGLFSTTLIGIGIILGAGIYALIGEGVAVAGANVWISFLAAAIVAGLTGLGYAELSSMYPKAGAEYNYVKNAFSKKWGFLAGWMIIVSGFIAISTVALGFGGYFQAFTGFPLLASAMGIVILSAIVVWIGVKQSAWIGGFFTLIETAGLLFIIWLGISFFGTQPLIDFSIPITSVLAGGALVFFAFIGFEDIVRMSEETKKPRKTIPRAIILSIIISSVLYILVAIAAISIVGAESLADSSAPLADVAGVAQGQESFLVLSIIALFSTGNTVLLFLLVVSRILYGMATEKSLPSFFGSINKRSSPGHAVFATGFFALLFLLVGSIGFVANITAFLLFVVFIIVNLSVIRLRLQQPNLERPFKVPLSIKNIPLLPVLGVLTSLVLLVSMPLEVIGLGIAIIVVGGLYGWKKFSQKELAAP